MEEVIENVILDLDLVLFDSVDWVKKTCPCCDNDSYLNREAWDMHHAHADMVKVNYDFIKYLQNWVNNGLRRIFFITSREDINNMRKITEVQLKNLLYHVDNVDKLEMKLYMRNALDYRPAPDIKRETLEQHIFPYYYIDLAVDDSLCNCEVYRDYNIPVWQYDKYR